MPVTFIETTDGELYIARSYRRIDNSVGVYTVCTKDTQIVFIYDDAIRQVWEEELEDSQSVNSDLPEIIFNIFQGNMECVQPDLENKDVSKVDPSNTRQLLNRKSPEIPLI